MAKEIVNSSLADEANEVEDIVSLRPDTTGVDNTTRLCSALPGHQDRRQSAGQPQRGRQKRLNGNP